MSMLSRLATALPPRLQRPVIPQQRCHRRGPKHIARPATCHYQPEERAMNDGHQPSVDHWLSYWRLMQEHAQKVPHVGAMIRCGSGTLRYQRRNACHRSTVLTKSIRTWSSFLLGYGKELGSMEPRTGQANAASGRPPITKNDR